MQVTVQPFLAFVDGGISDAQGGYPFVSDAVETLTLADGHGTLSRTDVVAAVVRDSAYDSSGVLEAAVEVVEGTPGAGVPSLPDNCVPLRNVVVPAGASLGAGGLSSGALSTDRRTWLASVGGVIPVASQTERDALPAVVPTLVYRADTDELELRRASGWEAITEATPAYTSYSPSLTGFSTSSQQAYYKRHGNTVDVTFAGTINAVGAIELVVALPFTPARSPLDVLPVGPAHAVDTSAGVRLHGQAMIVGTELRFNSSGSGSNWSNSVPFAWATGDRIAFTIRYECTT